MYKNVLKSLVVLFTFSVALELPDRNTSGLAVGSIVPVLLAALYAMLLKSDNGMKRSRKDTICINLLSIVFTLFYVLSHIEILFAYDGLFICLGVFIISLCGLFLFFRELIGNIVSFAQNDNLVVNESANRYKPIYVLGVVFALLLMTWGITFAILYPGIFGVDSLENLEQALGIRGMDVLFPFYMTLFLRFCWNIGITLFGSGNVGMAIYCLTQMIVMALVVAYLVYRIYKCNVKMPFCVAILLYFILIPYHAQSSIMVFKDPLYAVGTLLFMLLMWEYYVFGEPQGRYKRIMKVVFFVLGGSVMALSRANGFAAFLFCLPFALLVFYKRQKRIALYVLLTFVTILFMRGPVFDFIISKNNQIVDGKGTPVYDVRYEELVAEEESRDGGEETPTQVAVSNASASYEASGVFIITAQQLGRVVADRELSREEYDRLSTVINVDEMKKTYNKYIVTAAMNQINTQDTKHYLKVWLEFGLKYPYSYFIAWRDQTSGYWDPVLSSGGHDFTFWDENPEVYADSVFTERVAEEYCIFNELLPTRNPIIALLWSNGFMLWVTFLAIVLAVIKRNYASMVFYTPLIGLWLTLLVANPCNASFRYFYSFYLCLPLILIIPFVRGQHEKLEE